MPGKNLHFWFAQRIALSFSGRPYPDSPVLSGSGSKEENMSGMTVFFIIVDLIICLCLPTILAVLMIVRRKASWKAFVLGIAVFSIFQIFTRLPILGALQGTGWFTLFAQTNTVAYILILAFTAGLFEEGGRFIGMRFFMKNGLTWNNGVAFGLGHGGVEAFVIAGLPVLIGALTGDAAITAVPPYLFLVSGLERALAVTLHIGMTMLVLYGVKCRRLRFLVYAILFHMAVDSGALLSLPFGQNVWISEGYAAVFTVLSIVMIVKFKPLIDNNEAIITKWRF
jgi:uncharacterized membrane protein YhfC